MVVNVSRIDENTQSNNLNSFLVYSVNHNNSLTITVVNMHPSKKRKKKQKQKKNLIIVYIEKVSLIKSIICRQSENKMHKFDLKHFKTRLHTKVLTGYFSYEINQNKIYYLCFIFLNSSVCHWHFAIPNKNNFSKSKWTCFFLLHINKFKE